MKRTSRKNLIEATLSLQKSIEHAFFVEKKTLNKYGFIIRGQNKTDKYALWYDEYIDEMLCEVVAKDNAVKTIIGLPLGRKKKNAFYEYIEYKKKLKDG